MDGDKWRNMVIAEIDGLFYTIRALRPFLNRRCGSIIITVAKNENSGFACDILESYIRGLTISLSKSLNDANINVNAIIYENVEGVGTHVADATRQLASNSSSFMTGQIIRL